MAKRRGNNEGSIYRRADGKWQAQISVAGKRVGKTCSTRKECQEWIQEMVPQIKSGLSLTGSTLTFERYLGDWLTQIRPTIRDKTWRQYRGIVQQHILPVFGSTKVMNLKPQNFQAFYSMKLSEDTGKRTIKLIHQVLNKAFRDGMRFGTIAFNPVSVVTPPKPDQSEMSFFTDEEVKQFLTVISGHRIEALFHIAVLTGMRLGEILGLRWSDIDWASSTIRVKRQLQRAPGKGMVIAPLKTKRSNRTVQLGPATLRNLMVHREKQLTEFGVEPAQDTLVFRSVRGNPLGPRRVWGEFKALLKQVGLKDIRFHDLRHTAASLMLSMGVALIQVSQQLGHSKPSTTLDIYGHLIPGLDQDAGSRVEQLVSPIATELQLNSDFQSAEVLEKTKNSKFPS